MKRWITLLLAMVMALSLVVPAWAAGENTDTLETDGASTGNLPVTVNITRASKKYSVNVTWESLTFTYNQGTWQPEDHTYTGGNWEGDRYRATVTVVNHSNVDMWYTASLDSAESNGVTMTLSDTGAKLNRPVVGEPLDSQKSEFTVTVEVDSTKHDLATTVKNLTVQIFANDPAIQPS